MVSNNDKNKTCYHEALLQKFMGNGCLDSIDVGDRGDEGGSILNLFGV